MNVQRFLVVYSAVVTIAFVVAVFGFLRPRSHFDRITVHRIDVVEPDGTQRLILSDRANFPGSFYHRQEIARPDRNDSAGLVFINDEGTEDGGLIYGGKKTDGAAESFGHLSFDQYEQDQTVAIGTSYEAGKREAGLTLNDMPDDPLTPEVFAEAERIKAMPHGDARKAAWAEFQKRHPFGQQRASLARRDDGSVELALKDDAGHPRLRLTVAKDGTPAIEMLDAVGHVQKSVSPEVNSRVK